MAADRTSSFVLTFDGEAGTLNSVLAAFKAQMKSDVAELESITGKVKLFEGLQQQLTTANTAFDASKAKVDEIAASININLGGATKELQTQLAAATKEMNNAGREAANTQSRVDKLAAQLKAAGVNTSQLASEEVRLAAALQAANAAATNQAAQQTLGLKTLKDIQPAINQLNAAYNTLSVSGTLSTKELALAQQQLQSKVTDLRNSVTGVATAARAGTPDFVNFFQRSLLPALGITATLAGVTAGIKEAIAAANSFTQGVAEIGTVTNLSKAQLDSLGQGARDLALELGIDVNGAVKGLFDLIRAGVPPDNALTVLKVAAEAAKAALTDTATGVKAANLLIDSFGASLDDLPLLFDKIIRGAHDGGATLSEFAASGGQLLNVARAAGISFDDLLATLTVLVSKSGNAEKSIGDLTKIIAKLDTTTVRDKLRELGIEGDSLASIFQQIGARGLSLQDVLGLGLTGAGIKSAASLATLVNNSKLLPAELDKIAAAGGDVSKSLATLADTPKEKIDKLEASIHDLGISLGGVATIATPVIQGLTAFVNAIAKPNASLDLLAQKEQAAAAASKSADAETKVWVATLTGMQLVTQSAAKAMDAADASAAALGAGIANAADRANKASADLTDFSARLAADITAIQQASARDIGDVTTRADAAIALLDRSVQATAATAVATLAIQTKANTDKLAVIEKGEKDITAAIDKEVAARTALARKEGLDEGKIAADAAAARITALGPVLAQYQAFYASLIAQEQDYASKLNASDQARIEFNRGVEKTLFDIRLTGLSVFDQYVAKAEEADRLISLARQAGVNGDIEGAKKFTDEAIALAGTLRKTTDENGVVIVTQTQAQQQAIDIITKAQDGLNAAFDRQKAAALDGAEATQKSIAVVATKLSDLQGQYDALKKTVADGLAVRVDLDEASVSNALSVLDDLTRPREVIVTVKTQGGVDVTTPGGVTTFPANDSAGNTGDNTSQGFNRGGPVNFFARSGYAQRFIPAVNPITPYAMGGSVFRGPKVPGTGNTDTYPTRLKAGSFVLRKAASLHYGDAFMNSIARGYATGGFVSKVGPTGLVFVPSSTGTPSGAAATTPALSGSVYDQFYADAQKDIAKHGDGYSSLTFSDTVGAPTLPTDPKAKEKAVFDYIFKVREQIRVDRPGTWDMMVSALNSDIVRYQRTKSDADLDVVLTRARNIGLNLGFSRNEHDGFDVDGRKYHPVAPASPPPGLADAGRFFDYEFYAKGGALRPKREPARTYPSLPAVPAPPRHFYAAGGPSSDTIPAMLTPGEWVVPKTTVDRFGVGFFARLNAMALPKLDLAAMMAPPMRHFAEGGLVGDAPRASYANAPAAAPSSLTVNLNASAQDLFSKANVQRFLVPVLEDLQRKSARR